MNTVLYPADDGARIAALLRPESGYRLVDCWEVAARELREIDPAAEPAGECYAVFDWRGTVVKMPDSQTFHRLRTARNRYLIDADEQRVWSNALIGVAGLSVGAAAVTTCCLTGARRFRLADPDRLGVTNLNRLSASVCDIEVSKTTLARRRVLEIDPFAEVAGFAQGYQPEAAAMFLGTGAGHERLSVLVEEMDDPAAKVDIRTKARAQGIPVVMATDNGDNAILDVERFDLDPQYPLFHGRAGDTAALSAAALSDPRERARIAHRIVGSELTVRTRFSLTEVGRSLPSWPQLATAATVAGAAVAYAARLIVTGHDLPSGRYRLDVDRALLGSAADRATRWNELGEEGFLAAMGAADPRSE